MNKFTTPPATIPSMEVQPFYCDCEDNQVKLDAQWVQVLDTLPDQIFLIDKKFRIIHGNHSFTQKLKAYGEDFRGRTCYELLHLSDHPHADCPHNKLLTDHSPHQADVHAQLFDNFFTVSVSPIYNRQTKELIGSVHVARDISHLKDIEEKLRSSTIFLQTVFDSFQDGISVLDRDFNLLATNNTMKKWYQHRLPLEGRKCYEAFHEQPANCPNCPCGKALAQKKLQVTEKKMTTASGEQGWVEIYGFPLFDAHGQLSGMIEHVRDITKRKDAEEKLAHLAIHDPLTDLGNRIFLQNHFQKAVRETGHRLPNISFFVLDLDNFKPINDEYGHITGDKVLQQVAHRLRDSIREPDDLAIRMGGDEFVLFLYDIEAKQEVLARKAEAVLAEIRAPMDIDGHTIRVSASLGISFYPRDGHNLETLLRKADDAMYQVKRNNKNGFSFSPEEAD